MKCRVRVSIFSLVDLHIEARAALLKGLGHEVIERRMANARLEVAQARHFDFVIISGLFETALFDLKTVVHSQRLKYAAQMRNGSQVFAALDLI